MFMSPVHVKPLAGVDVSWLRSVVDTARRVPGFVGMLQYGSRATDAFSPGSDFDLIIVLEEPAEPNRVHTRNVDLNFISVDDLGDLIARLQESIQHPWDTMLVDLKLLADTDGRLHEILQRLESVYESRTALSPSQVDVLRFAASKLVRDMEHYNDDLVCSLLACRVLSLLVMTHQWLNGLWWRGLKQGLKDLHSTSPEVYQLATQCVREVDHPRKLDLIKQVADHVFRPVGGSWTGDFLVLESALNIRHSDGSSSIEADVWHELREQLEKSPTK